MGRSGPMPPEARRKGQARRNALMLFGTKGKMEPKGVREDLSLLLRMSSEPKFRALAQMASDETFKAMAFTTLMEKLDISYVALTHEYKELKKAEGFVRAGAHIPRLMEEAAVQAGEHEEMCRACRGTGRVNPTKALAEGESAPECVTCMGTGRVVVAGDLDRLKLVFDTFGLTAKGGLSVNLDLRRPQEQAEDLADLSASVAPIIEGTVVTKGTKGTT